MEPKFPYRLAGIDLDETLLGPDKTISPENEAAVRRLQQVGVQVVVASGRRHQNSIRFHRALGLHGLLIACQGGLVLDGDTGSVMTSFELNPVLARTLVAEGNRLGLEVIYYHREHLYAGATRRGDWLRLYEKRAGERAEILDNLESLEGRNALKIVWYGDPQVTTGIRPELTKRFDGQLDVLSTYHENLEFMPHGVTKATGLKTVAEYYHVPQESVIAFGDGENDAPMLNWAGLGVAMSCGVPLAKEAADLVSPDGPPETDFARGVEKVFQHAATRVPGALE